MASTTDEYRNSKLYRIRHSVAHVMAQAVLELFPEGKIAIGPPIKDGFYYDFDLPRSLTDEDLSLIESRTKAIVSEGHEFKCSEVGEAEIRKIFANQPYKIELMEDLLKGGRDEDGNKSESTTPPPLSLYQHSTFVDLCKGPHVTSLKEINPKGIKVLRTAGAYWRGDESRPMLQRIYGTAWETEKELAAYLSMLEEARKRDHRTLGKKYDLFSHSEMVGQGLVLWHPKGGLIRYLADRFSQEAHLMNGYDWVYTPHIGRSELWETSGHLDFYKEGMYRPIDIEGEEYYLKPMNCPFHSQIYKSRPRPYRELPKRLAEFGTVYRFERSGVLQGLTRVRGFTQDDAHIFCLPEQVEHEITHALRFSLYVLRSFGLEKFKAYISTRPEKKAIGSEEDWRNAEKTLMKAVEAQGVPFEIDEGGGAFYGPKIDLKLSDSLDREWQLSTVQFDFNLPKRFGLEYIGSDGQAHTPVMVHRALFGSAERFFAMLIEHYAGSFPFWLSPTQVMIVPVSERHVEYAEKIITELKRIKIRGEVDASDERMQAKIRRSEMDRIPYCFVVGDKEIAGSLVSVRGRDKGDLGQMGIQEFIDLVAPEMAMGVPQELA